MGKKKQQNRKLKKNVSIVRYIEQNFVVYLCIEVNQSFSETIIVCLVHVCPKKTGGEKTMELLILMFLDVPYFFPITDNNKL